MYEMGVETGMRAIVTGATGFIGKALCQELLSKHYDVVAVIRKNSSKRSKLESLLQDNPDFEDKLQIVEICNYVTV